MAYKNQAPFYPEGHTFTEEELLEITPDHVIRYFTMKLYGDVVPEGSIPEDKPIRGSHHTLGKSHFALNLFSIKHYSYLFLRKLFHYSTP